MIDIKARIRLSEAARALAVGHITNDQFEDRVPSSSDAAIREVYSKGLWPLYCDMREYRLVGRDKLLPQHREFVARCILFLKSGLRYEWPILSWSAALWLYLRNVASFGYIGRTHHRRLARTGNASVWPFHSRSQYEAALRSPPYLRVGR
jgi:hypothetical protein